MPNVQHSASQLCLACILSSMALPSSLLSSASAPWPQSQAFKANGSESVSFKAEIASDSLAGGTGFTLFLLLLAFLLSVTLLVIPLIYDRYVPSPYQH